jgi:hypothetical protein
VLLAAQVTVPCIDFGEMRRRCGVTEPGRDILDAINAYSPERRAAAYAVIKEMEEVVRACSRARAYVCVFVCV